MEAFEIRDLTFFYPGNDTPALRDVNLSVHAGEFFVLCGHSGCGKTTLLRMLKSALAPHGERTGEIFYFGEKPETVPEKREDAEIGFVLQSPEEQNVTDKVWHELAFGMENLGFDPDTIRRRSAETAAFFGIEDLYMHDVSELSGGQKQLLALASVMTLQPKVLILDEPTAQLDPIASSAFFAMLGKINRELGTTVILSEHRLEEALIYADHMAVMENGSVLCAGNVREVGAYLQKTKNGMAEAFPCAVRVWTSVEASVPCPLTVKEGKDFLSVFTKDHPVSPLPAPAEKQESDPVLTAHEIFFRYTEDGRDVLKNFSLTLHREEFFCMLGGNGSGKSTSLRVLAGTAKPLHGEITKTGRTALLPQEPAALFLKKTIGEDLSSVTGDRDAIARVSALCGLEGLLYRNPLDLSGGEIQRAALAKLLLFSPDILLLDEPTKGLDAPYKRALAGILHKLCKDGTAVLMVSHDTEFCALYADTCGMFFDGQIVAASTPREFFAGNSFYTTAANRMARDVSPACVTAEDIVTVIGGELPRTAESAPLPASRPAPAKKEKKQLPRFRKIGAAVSALLAVGVLLYSAVSGGFSEIVSGNMPAFGQLIPYGLFFLFLILTAFFLGGGKTEVRKREKKKLPKRTVFASCIILLLVPVTLYLGTVFLPQKQYYLTAVTVLAECMLPFFFVFEGKKPGAREIVLIAVLCALAVAGRAAFFMLPQFKPLLAMAILAGAALGGESGFLVGALSVLVSNLLFAEGPWTPFQMFAAGMIGFLAGILVRRGLLSASRVPLCIWGGLSAILIYGGLMNPASALIWGAETLNARILLTYYVTGFPMDAVHALSTVLFLWFGAEPLLGVLERLRTKYGMES